MQTVGTCEVTIDLEGSTQVSRTFRVWEGTGCCMGMFIDGTPWILSPVDAEAASGSSAGG
jgi:hypothetical protein